MTVEIGVFGGRSLLALAAAHWATGIGRAYGVDPWTSAAALADVKEEENRTWWSALDYERFHEGCIKASLDAKLAPWCSILRTTSDRAHYLFDDIDVLHIDGNHSEAASTADVLMWLPKVRVGGLVWFDDIDWPSTHAAQRLLEEKCDRLYAVGNCALFRRR